MRKVQACRKCGKVFAVKETTGPGPGMPSFGESGTLMCPSCGANAVAWMEEGQTTGQGCAGMVLLLIGLALVGGYLLW